MTTGASAQYHALVEEELRRERAGALGRAGRKVAQAIARCAEAERRVVSAEREGDGRERAEAAAEHREAFDHYQQARTDFCIQREANRLFDHRLVDRFYPPPMPPAGRAGRR